MNLRDVAAYLDAKRLAYNAGVDDAADVLKAKADELRAIGNPTALTMARIFDEQTDAVLALRRKP